MSSGECPVCADKYTGTVRSKINCTGCDFVACKECCKTYILGQSSDPHCMNCKQKWTRDFMFDIFGRGFVNTTYKQHKKELLFEIEKSKIPATMPRVEAHNEAKELEKKQVEIDELIRELKVRIYKARVEKEKCYHKMYELRNKPFSKPKEFRHHCPVDGCKGFLSKQWKCPVCATWACSKCHQIIGYHKTDPHVCKQSDIDSVEEIKKSTKPCPTCAVPIQKSVGCNQMWCTQCQVAFDWKTGEIQNGVIHNPHFFEAKRSGMIRAPGDNVCGGLPNYWDWDKVVRLYCDGIKMFGETTFDNHMRHKRQEFDKACAVSYRIAGENIDFINRIRHQVTAYNGPKSEKLRIEYITGVIDEKKYKTLITTQENSREKKQANLDILEIYNTVTIENFQAFIGKIQDFFQADISQIQIPYNHKYTDVEKQILIGFFDEFNHNIKRINYYVNKRAIKIGYYYNQSINIINSLGGIQTRAKVSKTELDQCIAWYEEKEREMESILNKSLEGGGAPKNSTV